MSHSLAPRPRATPTEIALVTAAVLSLGGTAASEAPPTPSPWRFSGRWFAAHPYSQLRRPGI